MPTVLDKPNTAPDLVGLFAPRRPAPSLELDLDTIDDVLTAILDREDVAAEDERARLRRARLELERQASNLLAE